VSKVLRFKVELFEISPPIWRRIEVPGDYSFWDLHVAIQDAMGWTDSHLHAFEIEDAKLGRAEIGIPDSEAKTPVITGWKRKLNKHFKNPGDHLIYEYDFGDSWRHSIVLESLSLAETGIRYPRCVEGAGKCPPEDCGGPPGFEEFLEVITDPGHEDHEDIMEWCGGSFDPDEFDPKAVQFDDPAERLKALF
jgi:hypothetical protein